MPAFRERKYNINYYASKEKSKRKNTIYSMYENENTKDIKQTQKVYI